MPLSNRLHEFLTSKSQPRTYFPTYPHDRWLNWTGVLEKEDWKYILTQSVYNYIFRASYKKCELMRFDSLTCEEIAVSVANETFLAVKNFCSHQNPRERQIQKSVRAFMNTISNTWFKNFTSRFYSDKYVDLEYNFEKFKSESWDGGKYILRTEILAEIFHCMNLLSEKSKRIINGIFFEDKRLSKLATEMQIKKHRVNYIKEQAEKQMASCLKSKEIGRAHV